MDKYLYNSNLAINIYYLHMENTTNLAHVP